jgi:hypothetical protein
MRGGLAPTADDVGYTVEHEARRTWAAAEAFAAAHLGRETPTGFLAAALRNDQRRAGPDERKRAAGGRLAAR